VGYTRGLQLIANLAESDEACEETVANDQPLSSR